MSDWDDATGIESAASPPGLGTMLAGRYRLDKHLLDRGTTRTWRAFDTKLSREVLVHLLPTDHPRVDEALDAARKASTATDSRFLRVLDALPASDADGEAESLIVCEFTPGKTLEQLLAEGPLSGLEAAWIVREVAEAMTLQHSAGNFHERLDPGTVVVTPTGSVKIVGFLIDAALHPDEGRALTWSEREASDVRGLGKILYACLVSEWPLDPGTSGPDYGLPHAPTDAHGWVTPRQVQAGVAPSLDAITDRVLSTVPRNNEQPILTASQLALGLSKTLGTADASADLERRLHQERRTVRPDTRAAIAAAHEAIARGSASPASDPGTAPTSTWEADSTAPFTPVPPPRTAQVPPPVDPAATVIAPTAPAPTVITPAPGVRPPRPASEPLPTPGGPPESAAITRGRRWLPLLVGLVVLAIFVLVLQALKDDNAETSGPGADAPTIVRAISGVDDFDPEADGGNDQENPNQLAFVTDGDPKTAWQTVTYLNRAKMGGLKPGVGVVLDLGSPVEVRQVRLSMVGTPTAVELRVPRTDASPAPMGSIDRWRKIAGDPTAPASVVFELEKPVTTRYLLVYVTSLPNVGANKYQASIAEIEVSS